MKTTEEKMKKFFFISFVFLLCCLYFDVTSTYLGVTSNTPPTNPFRGIYFEANTLARSYMLKYNIPFGLYLTALKVTFIYTLSYFLFKYIPGIRIIAGLLFIYQGLRHIKGGLSWFPHF